MNGCIEERKIEDLKSFNEENSNYISFDLYKNFINSELNFEKFWEGFSDFYYIICAPFDKSIAQRKNISEIHKILVRSVHIAEGHPLEILIWKYSEESMKKARKFAEEHKWICNPKEYMYLIGFYGDSTWRANQYFIKKIRDMFPDKIRVLKPDS